MGWHETLLNKLIIIILRDFKLENSNDIKNNKFKLYYKGQRAHMIHFSSCKHFKNVKNYGDNNVPEESVIESERQTFTVDWVRKIP